MSGSTRAGVAAGLGLLAWLTPDAAHACAVCFQSTGEDNRLAFIITTFGMTVLPLTLIGGLIYLLKRRLREMDREAAELARVGTGEPPST